jgi:NADH-quinone oxidoreductase subunit H
MEQNFVNMLIENPWIAALIIVVIPLVFVVIYALIAILGELKIASFVQERLGPMRTGWKGTMQPVAEVVKLLQKEDITPDAADKPLFNLAPFLMFAAAFAGFAVIPFSPYFLPAGIELGLFYVFAIGSLGVIGLVMGGWASNNKYSLLGAMRSVAQIVSYEIPAAIAILSIATLSGSLNLNVISDNQSGWFWNWYIFGGPGPWWKILVIPFTLGLGLIYLISTLAETNRTPFDIPEGESEIVAGYHTEYSGMKFAMFFFAEYANMFIVAAILTLLFFGGWNSPFGDFLNQWWMQPVWFILKAFFWVFLTIWLRWTLPRLRVDQLMYMSWKVLLPWGFVCFFAVSLFVMLK